MRPLRGAVRVRGGLGTQPSPGSVRTVRSPLARSPDAVMCGVMTSQSAALPVAGPGAQRVARGVAAGAVPVVAHHQADIVGGRSP
jgi:hypothetical protein